MKTKIPLLLLALLPAALLADATPVASFSVSSGRSAASSSASVSSA